MAHAMGQRAAPFLVQGTHERIVRAAFQVRRLRHPLFREEAAGGGHVFVEVGRDEHDVHPFTIKLPANFHQGRKLLAAGHAPRRPHVEHREVGVAVPDLRDDLVRSRRHDLGELRPHRHGAGQTSDEEHEGGQQTEVHGGASG